MVISATDITGLGLLSQGPDEAHGDNTGMQKEAGASHRAGARQFPGSARRDYLATRSFDSDVPIELKAETV